MKTAGLAMIVIGIAGVALASYARYVPVLHGIAATDIRLLGGILAGIGAVTWALVRGI